jgi:CheY-like chemotaxis protein
MPEMNGFEMLAHIKEKEELKEVPVVFLTSNNSKEHVVEAVKGGAVDYMVKPINDSVLLEKVHKILGEAKAEFSWDDI